ncbi:MAG: AmmeMemoRadiSam system protein B [Candidatus Micrarchaeota archaeon]
MREAAVAGAFYPDNEAACKRLLNEFFSKAREPSEKSVAVVSPHAGWIYSGLTCAFAINALKKAETFAVISPNHTGYGSAVSISAEDWRTPFGVVKNDVALGEAIADSGGFDVDEAAHLQEHSIEVILPFLQFKFKDFKVVPVTVMRQTEAVAKKLAKAVFDAAPSVGLVASSDFTHYEQAAVAKAKDETVIEAITELDVDGLFNALRVTGASVCGYAPIAVAMEFARLSGAEEGRLLHFSNSGEKTGDSKVVDYAAIAFT